MHRALEQDQVGCQRVGTLAGDLAGPGEVRPAALFQQLNVVQRLEVELRLGAHGPHDHVGGVVRADRGALPRDGGGQQQQPVQPLRRLRELLAELLELGLELGVLGPQLGPPGVVGLGELLRRALPARLGLVQFVLELAGGPVEVEQLVDVQVDALLPDGVLHRVRVLPYLSPVQHGYASVLVSSVKSRNSLLVSPPRKRYQQWPPRRPAVSGPPGPGRRRRAAGYGEYAATGKVGASAADQSCLVWRPDRRAGPRSGAGLRGRGGVTLRARRDPALGRVGQQAQVPAGGRGRRAGQPGRGGRARGGGPARTPGGRAGRDGRGGAAGSDKPTKLWFGWSPFPRTFDRFHNRIQREAWRRGYVEVLAAGALAPAALVALRGSRVPA